MVNKSSLMGIYIDFGADFDFDDIFSMIDVRQ